jgi:hypothetical protein
MTAERPHRPSSSPPTPSHSAASECRGPRRSTHDLAARHEDKRLDPDRPSNLDDDAARTALIDVKGVGRFTADGAQMGARSAGVDRAGRRARGALPAVTHTRRRVSRVERRVMSREPFAQATRTVARESLLNKNITRACHAPSGDSAHPPWKRRRNANVNDQTKRP